MRSNIDTIGEHETCCMVKNACGYSLKHGIIFVAVCTMILAMIALFLSMFFLYSIPPKLPYNSNPLLAINLMCALIATSTALYEIVISIIMLWFLRKKRMVFLLTLWFGSNVVLLLLFSILILVRAIICFESREYSNGALTLVLGVLYEVIYIYFTMIVSSYESSLDPETIYI